MKRITLPKLNYKKLGGTVPAVVQDARTATVLMVGFMNRAAVQRTLKTKRVTFWSRTKRRLWEKGEESGNWLALRSLQVDCDSDTLLIRAMPHGPTCHTGSMSCFGEQPGAGVEFLQELFDLIVARRKTLPKDSYTALLFSKGLKKILAKVAEESGEVIKAAKYETRQRLVEESADLLFHLFVLLADQQIGLFDVTRELQRRQR